MWIYSSFFQNEGKPLPRGLRDGVLQARCSGGYAMGWGAEPREGSILLGGFLFGDE